MIDRVRAQHLLVILRAFKQRRLSKPSVIDAITDIENLYNDGQLPGTQSFDFLDSGVQCQRLQYERDGEVRVEFGMSWVSPNNTMRITTLDIDDARTVLPELAAWIAEQEAA